MFNPKATNQSVIEATQSTTKYIITECPKARIWRIKWNHSSRVINEHKITENLLNDAPDEIGHQLTDLMNKAVEELTKIYLEYI